ncbi:MAG: hypothetical protein Q9170_001032 [Blastenia crenularia]
MPDAVANARIQFLDASARLLSSVVPETSAYLMQQRNLVAENYEKNLTKAQLKDICKACGTILIPDSSSRVLNIPKSRKRRKTKALESNSFQEHMHTECLACRRVTRTPIQGSREKNFGESLVLMRAAKASNTSGPEIRISSNGSSAEVEKTISVNANSKKRAKARKQGSLQALLEKSKGTGSRSSELGLDLMDFMKKT